MVNDITIKGGHPISENLSTITVGDQTTCLEISDKNGARVTGDLEVTGSIIGIDTRDIVIDDLNCDDITCDDITCDVLTATTISDFASAGLTITDSGHLTLTAGGNFTTNADSIYLDISDSNGLYIREDDSIFVNIYHDSATSYIKLFENPGGADNLIIQTGTNGATTIGTADAAGEDASLTLNADGFMKFNSWGYLGSSGYPEADSKPITLSPGTSVIIDKDRSHAIASTIKGLIVDVDRTGDVSSGTDRVYGIDVDLDHTGASGGTMTSYGLNINAQGGTGGTHTTYGIFNYSHAADVCYGIYNFVNPDAGSTDSIGIYQKNKNGGTDFKNISSVNASDYFTLNTIANGETTLTTVDAVGSDAHLNIVANGNFTVDATNTIVLDSADGTFVMKGAGSTPEFSVANSAYAGMILGYTTVGIDKGSSSKALTTAMVTTDADHNVSFIAPPSGVVEIFISIYCDFSRRTVILGLSDNATYAAIDFPNSADETNEHLVALPPSSSGDRIINHRWVVTGLTAGDTYKWWLGAKSSHILSNILRWGGISTSGQYAPFIMKATALPTAVTDFAVYG